MTCPWFSPHVSSFSGIACDIASRVHVCVRPSLGSVPALPLLIDQGRCWAACTIDLQCWHVRRRVDHWSTQTIWSSSASARMLVQSPLWPL